METADSISEQTSIMTKSIVKEYFHNIVNVYIKYQEKIADYKKYLYFHGLRDFYFLIKYICKEFEKNAKIFMTDKQKENLIIGGFKRNFGGLP